MREAVVSLANPLTDKWRTRVAQDLALDDDVTTLGERARAAEERKAFVADLIRARKLAA